MLKKIAVDKLKPGMYVAKIAVQGISLHEHEREGRIKDQKTIKALSQRGVKELYIDTEQGIDSPDAIPMEQSEKLLDSQIKEIADIGQSQDQNVEFEQEFEKASKIHTEALGMVGHALEAAKMGEMIELEGFENMAENFMDSVKRNQNALACLSRIRDKDSYLMEHSVNVAVLMSVLEIGRAHV